MLDLGHGWMEMEFTMPNTTCPEDEAWCAAPLHASLSLLHRRTTCRCMQHLRTQPKHSNVM